MRDYFENRSVFYAVMTNTLWLTLPNHPVCRKAGFFVCEHYLNMHINCDRIRNFSRLIITLIENNNSNNNNNDNSYGAVIVVHPVHSDEYGTAPCGRRPSDQARRPEL